MSNFLPNALIKRLGTNPKFDQEAFIAAHRDGEKLTSIRLNPNKEAKLSLPLAGQVPWCSYGYYLEERPQFTLDPLFHAGCYYVQEASSMFIGHILNHLKVGDSPIRALDVCAAPGGKSTLLNSYLDGQSLLVANEIIKSRSVVLQENMIRWGAANVVVSNNDPSAFRRLPGFFDLVLVDAPCSGSGMFRKDEDSIDEWSEANVKLCSERQQRILSEIMGCISTNGYLLYSTCSYSAEENEQILDWLIDTYELKSVDIPIEEQWGIERTTSNVHGAHGYRFYPHKTQGEGFFIGVLQMSGINPSFPLKKLKTEKAPVSRDALKGWVQDPDQFGYFVHNDNIHIFPKSLELPIKAVQQVLYLKNAGTMIGKWLGRELIPSHDLALSIHQDSDIRSVELELDDAQNFLRKEPLPVELFADVKKGWCLVTFQGVSIGWVKVLGNRVNNYYPKEVRIANL